MGPVITHHQAYSNLFVNSTHDYIGKLFTISIPMAGQPIITIIWYPQIISGVHANSDPVKYAQINQRRWQHTCTCFHVQNIREKVRKDNQSLLRQIGKSSKVTSVWCTWVVCGAVITEAWLTNLLLSPPLMVFCRRHISHRSRLFIRCSLRSAITQRQQRHSAIYIRPS